MREGSEILSLLGLCLRGRHLAVGDEAASVAAQAHQARLLLLSSDAGPHTCRRAKHLSQQGQCLLEELPFTRAQLGGALGRGSTALCAVTDTGLAAALVRRLEGLYPGRYRQSLERLELKVRRATERRLRGPRPASEKKAAPMERKRRRDEAPVAPRRGGGPTSQKTARPRSGGPFPPDRRGHPRKEGTAVTPGGSKPTGRAGRYAGSRPVKKGKGSSPRKSP